MGVTDRMVRYWLRQEHLGKDRAKQFRRAAEARGLIEIALAMRDHIAALDRRDAASRYVNNAVLFGVSGRWHMPSTVRLQIADELGLRRPPYYGTVGMPPKPPPALTDRQAAIAKPHLEKRGWTLIQDINGVWRVAPLATALQHDEKE